MAKARTNKGFQIPHYIRDDRPLLLPEVEYKARTDSTVETLDAVFRELRIEGNSRSRRLRSLACSAIIGHAYNAWVAKRPLSVPMSPKYYRKRRRYRHCFYTYRIITDVIKRLVQERYLLIRKGYRDQDTGKGYFTKLYCTEKLTALFPLDVENNRNELLLLKDKCPASSTDQEGCAVIEYKDTTYTKAKRKEIQDWNRFMESHVVELDGNRLSTGLFSIHSRGSWEKHGRFYGPFQNIPKTDRKRIIIDGKKTAEPDYSSLHIGLLYELEQKPIPESDLYTPILRSMNVPVTAYPAMRSATKQILLTAINAKSTEAAIRSYYWDRNQTENSRSCDSAKKARAQETKSTMDQLGIGAIDILKAAKAVHEPIAHHLCSDAGIDLMYHDSEIMRRILRQLINLDIPALPIHDSVRVPEEHESQVWSIMKAEKSAYMSSLISNTASDSITY